jgi:hypothetical protein
VAKVLAIKDGKNCADFHKLQSNQERVALALNAMVSDVKKPDSIGHFSIRIFVPGE